jgi:hypothetical protein
MIANVDKPVKTALVRHKRADVAPTQIVNKAKPAKTAPAKATPPSAKLILIVPPAKAA